MITLKNKIPQLEKLSPGRVNTALSEIQAIFNSTGVTRNVVTDAMSDYFVFDKGTAKLYLMTIEGGRYEVGLT